MDVVELVAVLVGLVVGAIGIFTETKEEAPAAAGQPPRKRVTAAGWVLLLLLSAASGLSLWKAQADSTAKARAAAEANAVQERLNAAQTRLDEAQSVIETSQLVRDARQVVFDACDLRASVREWAAGDRSLVLAQWESLTEAQRVRVDAATRKLIEVVRSNQTLPAEYCKLD